MSIKESLQLNLEQLDIISKKIIKLSNINLLNQEVNKAQVHYKAIEKILLSNEGEIKTSSFEYYFGEAKRLLNIIVKHRNNLLENQYTTKQETQVVQSSQSEQRENLNIRVTQTQQITMANDSFDIKTATAIVQMYNGDNDTFESFADAINLLKDLTKPDHMPLAIRFVKTRLSGKARLGLLENPTSLDDIIADVKQRCTGKITPDNILAKLKTLKPKADPNALCDDIDELASRLKATYISQGIPEAVAKTMATKAGVDALISNTTNYETKIILKAGTFQNLQEAIMKVRENATQVSNENNSQILTYNVRRFSNTSRYSRGNFNGIQRVPNGNPRLFNGDPRNTNTNLRPRFNNNYTNNIRRMPSHQNRGNMRGNRYQTYTTRGNYRNPQLRRVYLANTLLDNQNEIEEDTSNSPVNEQDTNNFFVQS